MKKFITVYDKYIFTQVLVTTLVAILLFTIVWIAPEMLLSTIKKVLNHTYTVKTGILVLLYEIPQILGKAFPVGLLLGSLFTFDKLSKDSELTIFRAVGMSFGRIASTFCISIFLVPSFSIFNYPTSLLVAKLMIFSCVASEISSSPVTRPSHMTTTRSDIRSSSGISEEIMMMDLPSAAS